MKTLAKDQAEKIDFTVQQAFGKSVWEPIKLLHGGLSGAQTYLIQADNKPYVVKLEKLDEPEIDMPRYFKALTIASDQNISPHIYFSDAEKGVILMEYIEPKPFSAASPELLNQLANSVRAVHSGDTSPKWKSIYDILNHFYGKLSKSFKQNAYIEKCIQEAKRLENLLSDLNDIRPCHCDLNPSNILFNGERLFFVDWQAASPQSLYFDLACVVNWFYFYSPPLCDSFLEAYFERSPTEEEKNKFNLMRKFVNIYYGIGFVSKSLETNTELAPLSASEIAVLPSYLEFMQSLGSGKVNLGDPKVQQQFGYVFLNINEVQI